MTRKNRRAATAANAWTGARQRAGDNGGATAASAMSEARAPGPDVARNEGEARDASPRPINIVRRLGDWRTILSFAAGLAILAFAMSKTGIKWGAARQTLEHANPLLFLLAFAVYYLSFPLRAHRWRRLMRNANQGSVRREIDHAPLWDLTRIIYLSYFANAVIPAKLGDLYRAYLAQRRIGGSFSRTVGTILAERILDLVVLFPLLLLAAALTFQADLLTAHNTNIRLALLVGLALAVAAGAILAVIWTAGERVLRVLPHRLHDIYVHFRHGAVHAFGRDLPSLIGQTIVIWLLEGARFACILAALHVLNVGAGGIGIDAAVFLALGSSVITTLPLTPAGLGLVEPFIVAVLGLLHVPGGLTTGAAVAVLERIVSYLSIVVCGFALYVFSSVRPRGAPARQAVGEPVGEALA